MNVDDIVKLALAFALLFAIVGISYELMRLIGSVRDSIKNANKIVDEMGVLSEKLVNDYDYISEQIKFVIGAISGFAKKVVVPLTGLFGFLNRFNRATSTKKSSTEDEN